MFEAWTTIGIRYHSTTPTAAAAAAAAVVQHNYWERDDDAVVCPTTTIATTTRCLHLHLDDDDSSAPRISSLILLHSILLLLLEAFRLLILDLHVSAYSNRSRVSWWKHCTYYTILYYTNLLQHGTAQHSTAHHSTHDTLYYSACMRPDQTKTNHEDEDKDSYTNWHHISPPVPHVPAVTNYLPFLRFIQEDGCSSTQPCLSFAIHTIRLPPWSLISAEWRGVTWRGCYASIAIHSKRPVQELR